MVEPVIDLTQGGSDDDEQDTGLEASLKLARRLEREESRSSDVLDPSLALAMRLQAQENSRAGGETSNPSLQLAQRLQQEEIHQYAATVASSGSAATGNEASTFAGLPIEQVMQALAQAQAQAIPTPTRDPAGLRQRRAKRYWKGKVLLNYLADGPGTDTDTDFLELCDPGGLTSCLFTTFGHDPATVQIIFREAFQSPSFKQLVIVDHYDRSRESEGIQKYLNDKTHLVWPHFPSGSPSVYQGNKYGIQHNKLYLLKYDNNRVRVIVSSCNTDDADGLVQKGGRQSQVFFVCDVKFVGEDGPGSVPPGGGLGGSLADVLEKMKPLNDPLSDKLLNPWKNILCRCNFDIVNKSYHLVASVPGTHPATAAGNGEATGAQLYGLARLRQLRDQFFSAKKVDKVEYVSSSVGKLTQPFWKSLSAAVGVPFSCLHFIWPSVRQIVANEGLSGVNGLCVPSGGFPSWMSKIAVALRLPKGRAKYLLHAKCMVGLTASAPRSSSPPGASSVSGGFDRSWLYIGSHNCSQNAWGRIWSDRDGAEKITCTSYELGVFIVGNETCQGTVLPVVVPSLDYESEGAVSIDGKVTELGKFLEPHFRRNPSMYHRDELLKYIGGSAVVMDICKILERNDTNPLPVAVLFCSSSPSHKGRANKALVEMRKLQPIGNPLLDLISEYCQTVKILDTAESKEIAGLAYQSTRLAVKSAEHSGQLGYIGEPTLPLLVIFDAVVHRSLGIGRGNGKTAPLLIPVMLHHGEKLRRLIIGDTNALAQLRETIGAVKAKMVVDFEERREAAEGARLQQMEMVKAISQKKVIIIGGIECLFQFKKLSKAHLKKGLSPCTFKKGRKSFFRALIQHCSREGIKVPSISILTNDGGVGLRNSMEQEGWGKNPNKYRTIEASTERQRMAREMMSSFIQEHYPGPSTAGIVRTYVSFSYQSHKDKSERALKSAKWFPTDSMRAGRNAALYKKPEWQRSWRKPATGMLQQATNDLEITRPSEVFMIGLDHFEDATMARKLNVSFQYAEPSNFSPGFFDYWEKEDTEDSSLKAPKAGSKKRGSSQAALRAAVKPASFSPSIFYRNTLDEAVLKSKTIDHVGINENTFDLRKYINDLCDKGKLRAAVLSTFRVNLEYVTGSDFRLTQCSIPTFILHGDAASHRQLQASKSAPVRADGTPPRKRQRRDGESDDDEEPRSIELPGNFSVHQVPAPRGTYHSKFALLFTHDQVHVIVATGNLVRPITIDASWVQVFAKHACATGKKSEFGTRLLDYLDAANSALDPGYGTMPFRNFFNHNLGGDVKSVLGRYDFSTSNVSLLTSIPGSREGMTHVNERYGHMQLRHILNSGFPSTAQVAQRHGARPLGNLVLQPTSIGFQFDGVQYSSLIHSLRDPSDVTLPEDRLIWPLMDGLNPGRNGVGNQENDGCVFMSSSCFLSMGQDGPLENSFYIYKHEEKLKSLVPHTKLYMRLYDRKPSNVVDEGMDRLRWIKLGSDCLSIGAQGKWENGRLLMRNWEMGVLFHETETNILCVGKDPKVSNGNDGTTYSTFPIPFEAVAPQPFQDENGEWPSNHIPYMHEMDPKETYPWTSDSLQQNLTKVAKYAKANGLNPKDLVDMYHRR